MAGLWSSLGLLVLAFVVARGQYDDFDFEGMMDGYGDLFGGYGGLGGLMGGMGYGDYGYGDMGPSHKDLADREELEAFMYEDPDSPSVIGYYSEDDQDDEIMVFRTTAQRMGHLGVRFGMMTEEDILDELKYKGGRVMAYPAKRFIVEGDRLKYRYPGNELEAEPLQKWIVKVTTPVVGMLTWETGARYQELGLPEVTTFMKVDLEEDSAGYDKMAATLRKIASERFVGKVSFNIADKEVMQPILSRCKVAEDAEVSVCIRNDMEFYRMDEEFGEEAVSKFVDAFLAGSLEATFVEDLEMGGDMGMEDEDDSEDDSHVVVVTPSNFDEVVMAEGKDVMIEFYAPWCGHCQHLRPVYREVAEAVADTPSIVVAKMDADAHVPPEQFKVQAYPTLMFLKAGDKANPISYEGPRDKAAIVEFIRVNASPAPAVEVNAEL